MRQYVFPALIIAAAVLTFSMVAQSAEFIKHRKAQPTKKVSRSLASSTTQGESMLGLVKESNPSFMRSSSRAPGAPVQVQIAGVCGDGYGFRHYSSRDRGAYNNCLEGGSASDAATKGFYSPAQRQAGVGILVGR